MHDTSAGEISFAGEIARLFLELFAGTKLVWIQDHARCSPINNGTPAWRTFLIVHTNYARRVGGDGWVLLKSHPERVTYHLNLLL